jgi:hypothetical protein
VVVLHGVANIVLFSLVMAYAVITCVNSFINKNTIQSIRFAFLIQPQHRFCRCGSWLVVLGHPTPSVEQYVKFFIELEDLFLFLRMRIFTDFAIE